MTKILETTHLILRTWTLSDAENLFNICRDDEVMKYIGTGKGYKTLKEAEDFLSWVTSYQAENGFCRWAIVEKSSGEIIGSCGFARPHETKEIELGYLLARKCWGKGFATEAAGACLQFGFEKLGFREIIAITDLENIASQKVLDKIGFARRGIEKIHGEDNLIYLKPVHS
ncbi:MAG: GNAT family N-acetyltransferase [Acidobacteriota bacterium]|nr:GNAT family N-acetyltransferase [Acidobacteriota bacterium]